MVNDLRNKKYILAYGGLRDGLDGAKFFNDVGHFRFIQRVDQMGYNLYVLGKMPVAKPTKNFDGTDRVVCDIMQCDISTFSEIYKNAIHNNFQMIKVWHTVENPKRLIDCYIFVWRDDIPDRFRIISGDWLEYIIKGKKKNEEKNIEKQLEYFDPSSC